MNEKTRTITVKLTVSEQVTYEDVETIVQVPADLDITDLDAVKEWLYSHESDWSDDLHPSQQQTNDRTIDSVDEVTEGGDTEE